MPDPLWLPITTEKINHATRLFKVAARRTRETKIGLKQIEIEQEFRGDRQGAPV